jgi:hypothetical protein
MNGASRPVFGVSGGPCGWFCGARILHRAQDGLRYWAPGVAWVDIPRIKTVRTAKSPAFVVWACVAFFPHAVLAANCPHATPNAPCPNGGPPANHASPAVHPPHAQMQQRQRPMPAERPVPAERPARRAPEPARPFSGRPSEPMRRPEARQRDEHPLNNQRKPDAGFRGEPGQHAPNGMREPGFDRPGPLRPGPAERVSEHRELRSPLGQHEIRLSPTATVAANAGHPGFRAVNRESARTSVVVEQRVDPQGHAHVNAYRQIMSVDGRTTTRVYTDGRRTVDGVTFHSVGRVSGPQFVRYNNGLRAAYMPNGRPLYTESFAMEHSFAGRGGPPPSIVQRTIYATTGAGQFRELATPIRRYYTVTRFGGSDTFVYRPLVYAAAVFTALYSPFAFQIAVGPQCLVCPGPNVVFAVPPERYSDPVELLGDMQVAGAVTDQGVPPFDEPATDQGTAEVISDGAPVPLDQPSDQPPDQSTSQPAIPPNSSPAPAGLITADAAESGADSTDLDKLKQQADELHARAVARTDIKPATLASSDDQPDTAAIPTAAVPGAAPTTGDTLTVPEDVRSQIHKEVRLSLAEHANEHPLTLIDIMQSGYSRIYLFQVATTIDTSSVITGDGCALGSGDLLAFASIGDEQERPMAQMKVVTAGAGHCLSHDVVQVSIGDLQDMLNAFNQRLEENIHKLNACVATKAGCVRS